MALVAPRPAASQPLLTSSFEEASRDVALRLSSMDPRTVAWGAYSAAVYRLQDSIPALERILETPLQGTALERRATTAVVLDALIELNASVPAALVASYMEDWPVQAMVLLANAHDRAPILLGLLDDASGFQWYGAANLLLASDRPGLATHLVNTVQLSLTVTVTDNGRIPSGSGSALGVGIGDGLGDGIGEKPLPYPPLAQYRFESVPRPGVTVLADGPQPVYYSRTVTSALPSGFSEVGIVGPTDAVRLAYLQAMLPIAHPGIRVETFTSVLWTSAGALLERVEALRQNIVERYRSLASELVQRYHISIDAQTLTVPIIVRLVDERTDRSTALPAVP